MHTTTLSEKLFNMLLSKGYNVKTLTSDGKEESDIQKAEMLSFDFTINTKNFGPVIILLNDDKDMEVFYGDTLGRTMDIDEKSIWVDLLYQFRVLGRRHLYGFQLNNINRLRHTVKGQAAITEGLLFEGYYGTSKTSYNPQGTAKIIIKHSKPLSETDKRYRYIQSIFIENAEKERFKLPFKTLPGARAMARHVTEGGTPYDVFGLHITEMVNDGNTLRGFVRRSKMFEDESEARQLVELGRKHYSTVRKSISQIAGKRGYHKYKESWDPSAITEESTDIEHIRKVFTREAINPKINEALPLIAKLSQQRTPPMREMDEFKTWVDNIDETDNTSAVKILNTFMAEPQPVGINALNVLMQLEDVLHDDSLTQALITLAEKDSESDARDIVLKWLKVNDAELASRIQYDEPQNEDLDVDNRKELYANRDRDLDSYKRSN